MKEIFIKYLSDIDPIEKIEKGDWIDLRSAEDIDLKTGDFKLIHLGVAMKLPKNYEAYLAPRSSTFKNYGIIQTNGFGVIDNIYCGDNDEWMMPVYATRDTHISKNDRVAQFRIHKKQKDVLLTPVSHLSDVNRGGFGSTGKK